MIYYYWKQHLLQKENIIINKKVYYQKIYKHLYY